MDSSVPEAAPRLVGVGLGPGDPALLTVRAIQVLSTADTVLVPQTERAGPDVGRAERIILRGCPDAAPKIRRVAFAMRERSSPPDQAGGVPGPAGDVTRAQARDVAAEEALACFEAGAQVVALATIGDPSVYSTFAYLAEQVRRRRPEVRIEVVPGITAMQAMAAAAAVPLVLGDQTLTLVPATAGPDVLRRALREPGGAVAAYKGGRQLPTVRALIDEQGRLGNALLGTDVGLPSGRIERLSEVDAGARAPYFSAILCPAIEATGGTVSDAQHTREGVEDV